MITVRNLQNIPRDKKIKKLFIPNAPNEVLVEADLSQAEARIVAWYAREVKLMNLYRENSDVHSYVASVILQRTITKENKIERQLGKTIAHASNYGTSPKKITEIVLNETGQALNLREAKLRQNIYYQNFPNIRTVFQMGIQNELHKNNGVLRTPVGFERKFYSPKGDDLYREAYAHYPQNIVAYITNQALIRLWDWKLGKYILSQNHDALLCSVPKDFVKEFIEKLIVAMTYPVTINGIELMIPVEVKIGSNWGELNDYNLEAS